VTGRHDAAPDNPRNHSSDGLLVPETVLHADDGRVGERGAGRRHDRARGQRLGRHDVEVDVVCTGRFYDFVERREGGWGIVRRQPIYEKDRMDPVDPAAALALERSALDRFPVGYRHLAYAQEAVGYSVRLGLPGLTGPAVDTLYDEGRAWLDGAATPGTPL